MSRRGRAYSNDVNNDEETCPWCNNAFDTSHHVKARIKPCGHFGCVVCLLRVLRTERAPHPCLTPDCGRAFKTFSAIDSFSGQREQQHQHQQQPKKPRVEEVDEGAGDGDEVGGEPLVEEPEDEQDERKLRIRQCIEYEPPDDLVCQICTLAYDHGEHQPVTVVRCFATPRDPYNDDAGVDRGDAPGCGHVMCNKCMQRLLLGDSDKCYFCRGCIKVSEVATEILDRVIENPAYAALTGRLNTAMSRNDIAQNVDVAGLQEQLKQAAKKGEELARVTAALAETKQALEKANEELAKSMSMNATLFDEVIDMRLERRDPSRLGITASRSGERIFLQVALQNRSIPRGEERHLVYGREVALISKMGMTAIRDLARELRSLTEMPTQKQVDESYIDIDTSGPEPGPFAAMASLGPSTGNGNKDKSLTMVACGSWLHRAIEAERRTPESILTTEDDRRSYQKVSRTALDLALGRYRRESKALEQDRGVTSRDRPKRIGIGPYQYHVPESVYGRLMHSISREVLDGMRETVCKEILRHGTTLAKCDAVISTAVEDISRGRCKQKDAGVLWHTIEARMQKLCILWDIECQENAPGIFLEHSPEAFIQTGVQIPDAVVSKMPEETLVRWKEAFARCSAVDAAKYADTISYIDTLLCVAPV